MMKQCAVFLTVLGAGCTLETQGSPESIAMTDEERAEQSLIRWLRHSSELGGNPNKVSLVDRQMLVWPPDTTPKQFWLFKFSVTNDNAETENGLGLVGSCTWSFFVENHLSLPPRDIYAYHCIWELSRNGLIEKHEDPGARAFEEYFTCWEGPSLENVECRLALLLSEKLAYEREAVAIATATSNGEAGWAVADGEHSEWYPKDSFPSETSFETVLSIHVGRRLLVLGSEPDRKKFISPRGSQSPHGIIERFKALEIQARALGQDESRGSHSLLDPATKDSLAGRVVEYAIALKKLNRQSELLATIEFLAPVYRATEGIIALGVAAAKCEYWSLSRDFLAPIISPKFGAFGEEGPLLAEAYARTGDMHKAKDWLYLCLKESLALAAEARGTTKDRVEDGYQGLYKAFVSFFPDLGEKYLESNGFPQTTRRIHCKVLPSRRTPR